MVLLVVQPLENSGVKTADSGVEILALSRPALGILVSVETTGPPVSNDP